MNPRSGYENVSPESAEAWRDPEKRMPLGHHAFARVVGFGRAGVPPAIDASKALACSLEFGRWAGRHLQIEAGSVGTWIFRFRPAKRSVLPGGSIRLVREANNMVLARGMQRTEPGREHYCTLRREAQAGGARFRHFAGDNFPRGIDPVKDNIIAVIEITDAPFEDPADAIVLSIGDTERGGLPAAAPCFAMFDCRYWVDVDFAGTGFYYRVVPPIVIDVVPGPAARLRAVAPSVVRPGARFPVRFSVEDISFNPWASYVGKFRLHLPDGSSLEADVSENDWGLGRFDNMILAEEGVYRLQVKSDDDKLSCVTNPILCSARAPRIVWGDTHCHTCSNDGHGSVEHNYRFARDVAFLDFFAIAEHSHSVKYCEDHNGPTLPVEPLAPEQIVMRESSFIYWQPRYTTLEDHWRECQRWARKYSRDGKFIAFLGYEWQPLREDMGPGRKSPRGDWCVLYKDIPSEARRPLKLGELSRMLDPGALVAMPHPGGRRDSLKGLQHDPSTMPSLEVASMHNRAEGMGQAALRSGWKIGFHGASDGHSGRPGYDVWPPKGGGGWPFYSRYDGERSGITGVVVDQFTRDQIWKHLVSRRHYATTGERILLSFSCGDAQMGGRVQTHSPPRFEISVHGTEIIAMVEIIRGDHLAHTEKGKGLDLAFSWHDPSPRPGETAYYVRVTQRDDAHAWSSPIFVTYTGKVASRKKGLPPWDAAIWPDETDAQRDPVLEGKVMEYFRRRVASVEPFKGLRSVGLFQDHRGKYVLLRAVWDGRPIQWRVHYEYPFWRISGKGSWNTHG